MSKHNANITNQFQLLVRQIQYDIDLTTGKKQIINTFRLKSILHALNVIQNYPTKIKNGKELEHIKGVGSGTVKRINEILTLGKLTEVKITKENDNYLQMIEKLEDVYGIGRKKAYELFTQNNISTVEELKKKFKSGEVDLPQNVVKGLKYWGKIKENIPRKEVDKIVSIVLNALHEIDIELFGIACGSYRRLKSTSNDVDFVIVHPKIKTKKQASNVSYLNQLITNLKNKNIIVDSLTSDDVPTKYMGIIKIKNGKLRRIDIRFIPYESYYCAILYFTGSKNFNKMMRGIAVDMGYTLNEYGLFKSDGTKFKITTEKDVFDRLHLEYVTPDKRNM
jgi:DNA polymerase/3'-5' exonuclease PolX